MASLGHESESKHFERLIDSIPSLIHTGRPDGYLDYFNQHWLEYLGLPMETILGWKWTSAIHPEDVDAIVDRWRLSLASGEPFLHESRVRRADGQYRWMLHHKVAARDERGEIVKWYGSSIDIEDRKQAEEQLRRNDFHLTEGQRLAHMGSWAFDATGFSYWSSELFRIYGLNPGGKPPTVEEYLALVHAEDRAFMKQGMAKMLDDHLAFDFTKRIVRPDGEIRRIRCVGIPVTHGGTFQGFLGTGMDVTEQQLLTEELERQQAHLTEAQKLTHTGSWAWRLPNWAVDLSEEWYRIYGFDPAKGAPTLEEYSERVHPEDRLKWKGAVERAILEKADYDHEFRILLPNGIVKWIHAVGHPVLSDAGVEQFVGSSTDITERKSGEQALQRSEAYLAEAQRLSHTGSFGWKPDTGEIVWSDETYRIFEYDRAVKPTLDLLVQRVHPEDRPGFLKVIESASAGATQFEHTYRWLLPDESVKHVHALAHASQDVSGNREFVGAATDVTSIKRSQEELRTSEAYLAEAQRLSQTGSWAWHPVTGDIRYWSEECYRVLGFDPHGPLPRFETFFQRLHPDDQAPVREQFEKAIRDKADFEFGYRIVHPDKGVRDIHVVGHAVLDRSGELHEFVGTVIDITERKAAEEALRSSEAYLAEAQRLSHTGSWAWSPDTDVRYWSEECYRVLGFDPRDGLPRIEELIQRIHPDDQPAFRESAKRTKHNNLHEEVDYRIVHPGGAVRDIHSIGHPVFSPCGDVIEYTGTVIDITERKRAEQELQQLVDFVPQLIVVFDSDGKVIHANRVAREYTGLTHEEFRSLDVFSRIIHPDDVKRVGAARKHGFAGSEPFELDARLLGKDGIHRWFLGRYNPFVEEGRARRWYVSATEIESRKQEEERVRQENVRLEERTRIAQELHDTLLQNFLSASMQLGATVNGVPSDSPVKVRLDRILQLMEQGIEDGRKALQGLRLSDTAPLDLVQAFSGIQRELAVPSDVEFRVTVIGEERPLHLAIQYEIYRIGREALINAFRHSRATRVEVDLEYADRELRMRVRDNGCGVDPRVVETGCEGHWGLAGMQERAAKIGGLLKICSNASAGTEVELSIPSSIALELSLANRLSA